MKFTEIVSSPVDQHHCVNVEHNGKKFRLCVSTIDGIVKDDYKSVSTEIGTYFSLSDATRKKHFTALKQYVEASLRAKSITCEKIIDDFDKYKIQLADNKKISATRFQAMQEAIYGCKVIVRRIFGEKQKVENAIVK
jgi:predicted protein tyrosine phosphatase